MVQAVWEDRGNVRRVRDPDTAKAKAIIAKPPALAVVEMHRD
jgi:hypothetical protein